MAAPAERLGLLIKLPSTCRATPHVCGRDNNADLYLPTSTTSKPVTKCHEADSGSAGENEPPPAVRIANHQ
jgi:hypothetical protein